MSYAIDNNSQVLVIGMARSGIAAAQAVRRVVPGAHVILADRATDPPGADEAPALRDDGIKVVLGRDDNALLDGCTLVIKSPGVPNEISLLGEARQLGIPVIGEVEFAWRYLDNFVVGVTGTNGKTTTTELIGYILRESGRECVVAGNVGRPLASLVKNVNEDAVLVVELSSFQLEDTIEFRPDVAVLLNLTEDHLDRHPDVEHYFSAKTLIFSNQGPDDVAILNRDDPNSRRPLPGHGRQLWFGRGDIAAGEESPALVYYRDGSICADLTGMHETASGLMARTPWQSAGYQWHDGRKGNGRGEDSEEGECREIIDWSRASLKGEHNLENSLAATAVCLSLGLATDEIAAGLSGFPGVVHRLQEVGTINGVTYINDSKATNVDSAMKALTAFEAGVHLILGGSSKGCSFDELSRAASGEKVKQVIVIGEAAGEIADSFEASGKSVERAEGLGDAVELARQKAVAGDAVLMSPACASFDQYRNYEERGEHFIKLVNDLGQGDN
jgi:UDP-N-acetylmuramoylalanine--D-glutamate ligase